MFPQSQEVHNHLDQESFVFKKIEKPLNIDCRPEGFKQEWNAFQQECTLPDLENLRNFLSQNQVKTPGVNTESDRKDTSVPKRSNESQWELTDMRQLVIAAAKSFPAIFNEGDTNHPLSEIIVRLVERESQFNKNAVNKDFKKKNKEIQNRSEWLMQLTKDVCNDIDARPRIFRPFFEKLIENDAAMSKFPEDVQKAIVSLGKKPFKWESIKPYVEVLRKKIFDPNVNMLLGSVYLNFRFNESQRKLEKKTPEEVDDQIEAIKAKITPEFVKEVNRQRAAKHSRKDGEYVQLTEGQVNNFMDTTLNDEKKMALLLGLSKYNVWGKEMKTVWIIYATVLMLPKNIK